MSLTFFRAPMSTATVTEEVLAALDVPHEVVTLDIQKGETKKPDHLKLNPNGKVPVLVHDGVPIWESSAITMYLGDVFGTAKNVWPAPGPTRGEAMKWVAWANVTLGEAIGRWMRNTSGWVPADQQNAKAGEVGKKDVEACLQILDEALAGRSFLAGDYTLADTHVRSFVDWLRHLSADLSRFTRIEAWEKRCGERVSASRSRS